MGIVSGSNVYPREVELELMAHPAVADAAVIGAPDPRTGERVRALVVPAAGAPIDVEDLLAFCRTRLARFKVPRDIRHIDKLPRNPTGKIMQGEEIMSFCNVVSDKVPVFVDEAYWDYMENPKGSTVTACIKKGANVIVARTFSKVHAFAGLRVGYCIAQPDVIAQLAKEGPRNTLSGPSMNAAAASLVDYDFIKYSVAKNNEGKQYVYDLLSGLGYDYYPSHTNFILFPISMVGDDFRKKMMEKGVSIRTWNIAGKDYCRVSMGKMKDLEKFGDALKQVTGNKINKT
jgi:histidinol-phosphate aminotransferase